MSSAECIDTPETSPFLHASSVLVKSLAQRASFEIAAHDESALVDVPASLDESADPSSSQAGRARSSSSK
jgi:hypothetical protein